VAGKLWTKWKRFAHRAAEIQSLIILGALYWIVVTPIGMLRRARRADAGPPRWTLRKPARATGIDEARRQF
jgi:hypothetical protein